MRTRKLRIPLLALLAALGSGLSTNAADKFYPGALKGEAYFSMPGPLLDAIAKHRTLIPGDQEWLHYAEFPPASPEDGTVPGGDPRGYVNTLEKISGFIVPPTDGDYVIFHSSDDNGGVWLSTDESPANLKRITAETVWSNPRQYISSGGGSSLPSKRSDQYTGTEWPTGNTIHLLGGHRYYIESFGLEGGGGDNDSFIVVAASDAANVVDGQTPATGDLIGVMGPDATTITNQPASQTIAAGSNAKFSVGFASIPTATYTYQWTKGGVNIDSATGSSYQTGALTASDSGGQYAVKITEDVNGVQKVITSATATVTVVAGVSTAGFLKFDYYDDPVGADGGVPLDALLSNPIYPDSPTESYFISAADSRLAFPDDSHEQYGARLSGTIHVLQTGDYDFFIRSDDSSALWLNQAGSALPNPSVDTPIAQETDCCGAFSEPGTLNTDGATSPTTATPIHLVAGTEYGLVMLYKEGGGGDYGQIAIRKVGDPTGAGQLQPIPAAYLATTSAPGGPVTITQPPASINQPQNSRAVFTVAYNTANSPVVVQWQTNGVSIPFANGTNFVIDPLPFSDNGITVRAVVWTPGGAATSAAANVVVTQDTTPPKVVSVAGSDSLRSFTVTYSEAVTGADVIGNYTISPNVTINSITALSSSVYQLNTAKQAEGTEYTITANSNVKDTANPANPIAAAPDNQGKVTTFVFVKGIAIEKKYDNIGGGTAVSDLTGNAKYPNSPDHVIVRNNISIPDNTDNQFGATVSGYFIPPTSGDYVFFITSDDNSALFLSTDEDPANLKQIAVETAWSNANKQYIGSAGGSDLASKRSDQYPTTQWPTGNTITLVANNKYYYRALVKEGGGGDNMSVLALTAAELAANDPATFPAEGTAPTGGTQIGVYVDPNTIPPVITGTTADKRHFNKGDTINLAVTTSLPGTYTYQWYHNKIAIPGATSATLQLTSADYDDVGDYNVTVTNASGTSASNAGAADDNLRLIMNGAFLIEAEDFNYQGGQTVAAASTMPYLGGAYDGLIPTLDVDFNNGADESGASVDAFRYNRFTAADPAVSEIKGGAESTDNVNSATGRDRGSFTVNANYAVGWANSGNWANYTRTFPAGKYVAVVGAAYDGTSTATNNFINQGLYMVANPTVADGSAAGNVGTTAGPMKGNQGLTKIGEFRGYQTGAWSSNDLVPLVDPAGNIVKFDLTGTQTLRWNDMSGDADFILLYKVGELGGKIPANITVAKNANGTLHITWDQPGTLQKAAALLSTGTVWTDVTSASPYDATINADAKGFYRINQ